jgi:hypothetical protein
MTGNYYYTVKPGGKVEPAEGLSAWAKWIEEVSNGKKKFEEGGRIVAQTEVEVEGKKVFVSTVFLGINHNFSAGRQPPVLFETMIFGGKHDEYQERYKTVEEAKKGHEVAIQIAKGEVVILENEEDQKK